MTQSQSITIVLEEEKLIKMKNIIKDLFKSNSINSDEIEEFIKFTLFIVIDEYERDVPSLKKFYSMNLAKYLEKKDGQTQTKS
ncbi:hypothetical protein [Candidatus Nitrosocosmicus arcticus]|uniref:Uncharacterized protein n=1 Tax=Candidatus Nitrosocosmicus arcticus TaxID=2035267 RepID=A0A557SYI7_9ARCH|nr:hypothetical protein [Candidatus Nitrosocosmicus arcticus]TVP41669.1 hypothetical protein NARC_10075 [Candidatus Nitrosocosmicus arcticus]